MSIAGIDAITYSTERRDDARRFFSDRGLTPLSDAADAQDRETLTGAQVRVRRPDDAALAPPIEAGPTLREVTWGVESDADLDALAAALAGQPGFADRRASHATVMARDPHGLALVFLPHHQARPRCARCAVQRLGPGRPGGCRLADL